MSIVQWICELNRHRHYLHSFSECGWRNIWQDFKFDFFLQIRHFSWKKLYPFTHSYSFMCIFKNLNTENAFMKIQIFRKSLWSKYLTDIFNQIYILGLKWMVSVILPWKVYFNNEIYLTSREGNGTPLQYSCLEHTMDGGAW